MATPLNRIAGVGPKTATWLREKGIDSAEMLIDEGPQVLEGAPGFHPNRIASVIASAEALLELSPAADEEEVVIATPEEIEPTVSEPFILKKEKKKQKKSKGKKDKKKDKAKKGKDLKKDNKNKSGKKDKKNKKGKKKK